MTGSNQVVSLDAESKQQNVNLLLQDVENHLMHQMFLRSLT